MNAAYPEKLITEATKVSAINLQNPVFKNIFESYPQNPDLPAVKKYYQLSAASKGRKPDGIARQATFLVGL